MCYPICVITQHLTHLKGSSDIRGLALMIVRRCQGGAILRMTYLCMEQLKKKGSTETKVTSLPYEKWNCQFSAQSPVIFSGHTEGIKPRSGLP